MTRHRLLVACAAASALLLAGCSTNYPSEPDTPPPAAVCIPSGDGETASSFGTIGPIYYCASKAFPRPSGVAYVSDATLFGEEPITGWMNVTLAQAVSADERFLMGLDNSEKKPSNLPKVAACLWDGFRLVCVSNDHKQGFMLLSDGDNGFTLYKPLAGNTDVSGIPESLTRDAARDFLSGYAIWTYDDTVEDGPWPA